MIDMINPVKSENFESQDAIDLILQYINDIKKNKIPAYPLKLKGTEHESIIKELSSLIVKQEQVEKVHQTEIENLLSKKEEAQNAEKEHIQFMLALTQNILNPLNGILGFVDIILSSGKELSPAEKEKYHHFIKQGELSLLQNIDYISTYAHIMSDEAPGKGYCRTKHLLNEVQNDFTSKILPKYIGSKLIEVNTLKPKEDYFIQLNENALKVIWLVVLEYLSELFNKQIINLSIFSTDKNIILRTEIEKPDYFRKEEAESMANFMLANPENNLFKPQLSIPLFIAQKQLKLIGGEYKSEAVNNNIYHIDIIIPDALVE